MSIIVKSNKIGIGPQKVRQVCDLVRDKKVSEALKVLRFCQKREIAIVLTKLLNSGLAIAQGTQKYDLENLVIGTIYAKEGPMLKRIQARAQGRAYRIRKRSSHVYVELKEA